MDRAARKANYDRLLKLAEYVREQTRSESAVQVVDTPIGLGLVARRDIPAGTTVVWYGGPFRRSASGVSRTHSVMIVDRTVSPSVHQHSVVDGEVVSAAFNDDVLSDEEKESLWIITGAIANSSRDTHHDANIIKSDEDALFVSISGVPYAATRFVAAVDIREGDEIRWDYAWSSLKREKLQFFDTTPHLVGPEKKKRRIVPTPVSFFLPNLSLLSLNPKNV